MRLPGMIDRAGRVRAGGAVEVVPRVQAQDVDVALGEPPLAFAVGNPCAGVGQNPGAGREGAGGKEAFAVEARGANADRNHTISLQV